MTINGFCFSGEIGIGGYSIGMGYSHKDVGFCFGKGFSVRLAYLETWWTPLAVEPNQSFYGLEVRFDFYFTCKLGYYYNIDEDAEDDKLFALSLGIGF